MNKYFGGLILAVVILFPFNIQANQGGMTVKGDWLGNKHPEELKETLVDNKTGKIVNRDITEICNKDFDPEKLRSEIVSSNKKISKLVIKNSVGLLFINNEHDLDGDGRDEISVVQEWCSSSIRELQVYSYINNKWVKRAGITVNISLLKESYSNNDKSLKSYEELITKSNKKNCITAYEYDVMVSGLWTKKEIKLK